MAHRSYFKWELPSRLETARAQDIDEEANWRAVCRHVSHRDDYACRVCGRRCHPDAVSMLLKGHHHHIVYRSAGGPDTKENVCLLCADCHDAEHNTKKLHIEGNAETWLTIYRRDVESGEFYVWKQETGIRQYERD